MCEKGIILIIVIFLLFPLEANTNDNYIVDGRIFGRMHSWPVQSQLSLDEHVWNIVWNYTPISWIRGGQVNREFSSSDRLLFSPRRVFPSTVQSVLRWWSFVSALSVFRVERPWWPDMLPLVCSTRGLCCSIKTIYRSILVHVPRFDSSTIFFCTHWSLLRQIQVGPGIITHHRDWSRMNSLLYPDAKSQQVRLRLHCDFISSVYVCK